VIIDRRRHIYNPIKPGVFRNFSWEEGPEIFSDTVPFGLGPNALSNNASIIQIQFIQTVLIFEIHNYLLLIIDVYNWIV